MKHAHHITVKTEEQRPGYWYATAKEWPFRGCPLGRGETAKAAQRDFQRRAAMDLGDEIHQVAFHFQASDEVLEQQEKAQYEGMPGPGGRYTTTLCLNTQSRKEAERVAENLRNPSAGIHAEVFHWREWDLGPQIYDVRMVVNRPQEAPREGALDPRKIQARLVDLEGALNAHLAEAEQKAWDSLARYKFQMFGYWAAIWVHLNRIQAEGTGRPRRPSPWSTLVRMARAREIEPSLNQEGHRSLVDLMNIQGTPAVLKELQQILEEDK